MATAKVTKKQTKEQTIKTLIKELKQSQFQVWLLSLPEEDIEGYAHPGPPKQYHPPLPGAGARRCDSRGITKTYHTFSIPCPHHLQCTKRYIILMKPV